MRLTLDLKQKNKVWSIRQGLNTLSSGETKVYDINKDEYLPVGVYASSKEVTNIKYFLDGVSVEKLADVSCIVMLIKNHPSITIEADSVVIETLG